MKKLWQLCRIGKQYDFSAAHHLPLVYDGHPCKRMHGHNYLVEVEIRGEIAPLNGFCNQVDFSDIDQIMKPIIAKLDHQVLNDFIENPTAENIAAYLLSEFQANSLRYLFAVKVWETPKCWAMVVNDGGFYEGIHRE